VISRFSKNAKEIAARGSTQAEVLRDDGAPAKDHAFVVGVGADGSLTVEWVNDEFVRITGYQLEELRKPDAWRRVVHPDHHARTTAVIEQVLRGETTEAEIKLMTRAGEPVVVRTVVWPVWDVKRTRVVRIYGASADISARLRAEEELRNSEEFWRLIVTSAADFICLTDTHGRMRYANRNSPRRTVSELLGTSVFDYIPESHRAGVQAIWADVVRTTTSRAFETPIAVGDGEVRWQRVSVAPFVRNGRVVGLIHTARDVTDYRNMFEALRRSEALWRSLLDSAPSFVWLLDTDGTVRFANRTLHHKNAEEAAGTSVYDYTAPEHRDLVRSSIERVVRTGDPQTYEIRGYGMQGRIAWYRVNLGPLVEEGRVTGLISIASLVDAEKRAQAELRRSRKRMEGLSQRLLKVQEEERRRMAREIHDELGQSLTALRMDLVWMREHLDGASEPGKARIGKALELVGKTIETVRKLAGDLRPGMLDDLGLVPTLDWQMNEFRERSGTSCEFDCSPEDIELDPALSVTVFRVFQEALTNVARHAGATRVSVNLRVETGTLELSIQDNGRGITQQETRSSKSIGLIGIRERVRWCGGRVSICGVAGKGTTVKVRMPIDKVAEARSRMSK
jgi:PAS domain S-box-containing protein